MIFRESLPLGKTFFAATSLPLSSVLMLTRLVVTCFAGLHSAAAASTAVRTDPLHRAQVCRFLARMRWSANWLTLAEVADLLLQRVAAEKGTWVFILDQTHHTMSAANAQNAFSHGNTNKRPRKSERRQKKKKRHKCHCFMFGVLISPVSGTRIPVVRSYYTQEYCQQQAAKGKNAHPGVTYRTQADIAAEMIDTLTVPEGAKVLFVGDTAFEAGQVRAACERRSFDWITPANPERMLAGGKPRRKLTDKGNDLCHDVMTRIELSPGRTCWCVHQRGSKPKAGKDKYSRLYWAHAEALAIHNMGVVGVTFSTTIEPNAGQPVKVQKILLTNRTDWNVRQVVEAYAVRWQVELFFKEMKSFLGLERYKFKEFRQVEGWVQACAIAFVYLEWYRLEVGELGQMKEWWRLRTSGLIRLVQQAIEMEDLRRIADMAQSDIGCAQLRERLAKALPAELRPVA
jgi:hypothetical protein